MGEAPGFLFLLLAAPVVFFFTTTGIFSSTSLKPVSIFLSMSLASSMSLPTGDGAGEAVGDDLIQFQAAVFVPVFFHLADTDFLASVPSLSQPPFFVPERLDAVIDLETVLLLSVSFFSFRSSDVSLALCLSQEPNCASTSSSMSTPASSSLDFLLDLVPHFVAFFLAAPTFFSPVASASEISGDGDTQLRGF